MKTVISYVVSMKLLMIVLLYPPSGAASIGGVNQDANSEHTVLKRNVYDSMRNYMPDSAKMLFETTYQIIAIPVEALSFGVVNLLQLTNRESSTL
ncbi:GH15873 [Drosophila grimshawi]|uniref:GH15873 n=1 Tax=Drosophila grimshawi TaxID=7222 RepID=B4J0D9_DROGR|nr:GH15873 [Drosophila grimshawi]